MNRFVLFFIEIYQKLPKVFPSACVFSPSCSQYAKDAFGRYSFHKALFLSVSRLLRCNSFSRGGFDPVR